MFVPVFVPFTFHWYDGVVPPLVGAAENVTLVPAQTGLADAPINTLTGSNGFVMMVADAHAEGHPGFSYRA